MTNTYNRQVRWSSGRGVPCAASSHRGDASLLKAVVCCTSCARTRACGSQHDAARNHQPSHASKLAYARSNSNTTCLTFCERITPEISLEHFETCCKCRLGLTLPLVTKPAKKLWPRPGQTFNLKIASFNGCWFEQRLWPCFKYFKLW